MILPSVTITHIPTGISAKCDSRRSPKKNYDMAYKILRSRIFAQMKLNKESGDNSELVATYSLPDFVMYPDDLYEFRVE